MPCKVLHYWWGLTDRIWCCTIRKVFLSINSTNSYSNCILVGHIGSWLTFSLHWFQTTLYTRVLLNVIKRMKKSPILLCTFLRQYLIFLISPLHPAPIWYVLGWFKNISQCWFKNIFQCWQINMHRRFVSFFLVPTKKHIFLFLELSYFRFFFVYPQKQRNMI